MNKKKIALFAFKGEAMCFVHVLFNAMDLEDKGHEAKIIFEGAACALIPKLAEKDSPLHGPYEEVKKRGLIAGTCRACSKQAGALEAAEKEGIALLDDMKGHPSVSSFMEKGYEILIF